MLRQRNRGESPIDEDSKKQLSICGSATDEESRLQLSLWLTHCMRVGRVAQQDRSQ